MAEAPGTTVRGATGAEGAGGSAEGVEAGVGRGAAVEGTTERGATGAEGAGVGGAAGVGVGRGVGVGVGRGLTVLAGVGVGAGVPGAAAGRRMTSTAGAIRRVFRSFTFVCYLIEARVAWVRPGLTVAGGNP